MIIKIQSINLIFGIVNVTDKLYNGTRASIEVGLERSHKVLNRTFQSRDETGNDPLPSVGVCV